MNVDINKDFYCTRRIGDNCPFKGNEQQCDSDIWNALDGFPPGFSCDCKHRKYPTLEQFKEEYGIEIKENTPVYIFNPIIDDWQLCEYWRVNQIKNDLDRLNKDMGRKPYDNTPLFIICCTPFNKPDKDWRPE